MLKIAHT